MGRDALVSDDRRSQRARARRPGRTDGGDREILECLCSCRRFEARRGRLELARSRNKLAKEEFRRHSITEKLIAGLENEHLDNKLAQERARVRMGLVLCIELEEDELHTVTHLTQRCISQLCLDLEKKQQGKAVFMSLHDLLALLVKVRILFVPQSIT